MSPALFLGAGVAFIFTSKASMTLEYRRLFARARFDAISDDPVHLGGDALLAGFRHAF